jgi:uncharacterized repeat protein (TIGR01451 family)
MKQSKILWLIIFLLFNDSILWGQGWIKEYQGSSGQLFAKNSVASRNNGFLSVGFSINGSSTAPVPLSIIKADSSGMLVWRKEFDTIRVNGDFSIETFQIIKGNDNGYIVVITNRFSNTRILKIDEFGSQIWYKEFNFENNNGLATKFIANKAKTNYCLYASHKLLRIGNNGDFIRQDSVAPLRRVTLTDIELAPLNSTADFVASGYVINTSASALFEIDTNDSLKLLTPNFEIQNSRILKKLDDGSFITFGNSDYTIQKLGVNYQIQWTKQSNNSVFAVASTIGGGFVTSSITNALIPLITRYDKNGNVIWQKEILKNDATNSHSILNVETDKYIIGYVTNGLHAKINGDGDIYSVNLVGNVINDQNSNCSFDVNEPKFRGEAIVKAFKSNTNETFYGSVDSMGKYLVNLDTGNYVINLVIPYFRYWTGCLSPVNKNFLNFPKIDTLNFLIKPTTSCPAMFVDIATPFLRRCFTNDYNIRYCNQGTATAAKARIEIQLDSLLEYVSATRPLSIRNGQTLIFNLGDVPSLDCGSFSIKTRTRCGDSTRLGQTLCTIAKIFPDTVCSPPSNWSGANLIVNGRCDRDSVRFFVKNTSAIPTTVLKSIIVEDEIVFMRDNRSIAPNGTRIITLPANGKTWRINQEQEPNNPRNTTISAVIEGCRLGNGGFSTGFVNDFPNTTGDPSVSFSCMPIVGSFDPNEKLAFPEGYKNEHFIEQNTAIDYQIGFQNTGNDTAFTVILRDTLSNSLDISTLKMGSASHKYSWDLVGKNVLTVTFNDINLVDSFKNEPASHGFVKFRINQKKDVALGTRIENKAAIYFDFNAPIFTNKTFHVVGTSLLRVSVDDVGEDKVVIKVYPNPFLNQATFELPPSVSEGIFELFDVTGKILRREKFEGNVYEFYKKELSSGIFIFKITTANGRLLGNGKIVAQ